MCLYPTLIRNPKYKKTKKNGGNIPPLTDPRCAWVPIGCQQCMECRKQKARAWQVRLLEDIKTHKNGKFITLTFSNEWLEKLKNGYTDENGQWIKGINDKLQGYDIDNAIATLAVRRFLERWRKQHKKSVRHWLVSELGQTKTEHLHIHGIIWTNEKASEIEKHWKYGYVWKGKETRKGNLVNYVNGATCNYIIKYVNKTDETHPGYKSITLCSKGIGNQYTKTYNSTLNKFKNEKTEETYRTNTGHKIALPIYWRNKTYTEKEREQLWIIKLDKQVRYVCGEKISVKNGDQAYERLLKWHQKRNEQLGYGGKPKTWEEKQYEQQRRNLKINERIQSTNAKKDAYRRTQTA